MEERIMEAMLACCGELGYRRVAVEQVCRRYGGYRSQFYRHFHSKSDCFLAAYDREANRLADRLVACADGEGPGEERLRAALEALGEFVSERSTVARALFVEVHVAGPEARDKRQEVFERLTRALDGACRETASRHSPPPIAGEFMISAIDQAVSSALLAGRPADFTEAIPELGHLVCLAYGGGEPGV